MPKELVLHEGQLAEKIVTESYQVIELGQLEAEVNSHQSTVDSLTQQIETLTTQRSEAEAALEDSKSNFEAGKALVEVPADPAAEGEGEDGASEPSTDGVAEPNTDF
jgi:multidrug resistance efflux pump